MGHSTVQYHKLPSVVVGCVYRHPHSSTNSLEFISDVFGNILLRNRPFYVFGDFNNDLLSKQNKMERLITDAKLTQLIRKPTRITPHSATLIDLIITNKPESVTHSDSIPCPVADHDLVTATIDIRKPKREPVFKTFRKLKNYSPESLCSLFINESDSLNPRHL